MMYNILEERQGGSRKTTYEEVLPSLPSLRAYLIAETDLGWLGINELLRRLKLNGIVEYHKPNGEFSVTIMEKS